MHRLSKKDQPAGFSTLELLASTIIVSIFSSVGIFALSAKDAEIERVKLEYQVSSLNAAIQAYELSGGVLDTAATTDDVLAKLKSFAQGDQKAQIIGQSESFIDPRLIAVPMTAEEAASSVSRAIWDPMMRRFVTATSGTHGTREFTYGDSGVIIEDPDARRLSVKLAMQDKWVWDYTDQVSDSYGTSGGGGITTPISDVPTGSGPTELPIQLAAPDFSVAGGTWHFDQFGFTLEMINPNPSFSSTIFYSINDEAWEEYAGPIVVAPEYIIEAYAISLDPKTYADSVLRREYYQMVGSAFSGVATGTFQSLVGGEEMVATTSTLGNVATMETGTSVSTSNAVDSPTILTFTGHTFSEAAPGELFSLGTLDYLNGTVENGTEAWQLDMAVDIDFSVPEVNELFLFTLGLESTINSGLDPDADADYISMLNITSEFSTVLNGITYALEIQFGYDGTDGFATADQFHVYEGTSATANIYGTIVAQHEPSQETLLADNTVVRDSTYDLYPPETTTTGDLGGPGTADIAETD